MKKRKYLFSATAALLVLALLVSLGNGIMPAPVKAATSSELKEQLDALKDAKDELSQKIKDLEKQQAENFGDMESIIKQKAILDQQVALLYAEISNVNTQIAAYSLPCKLQFLGISCCHNDGIAVFLKSFCSGFSISAGCAGDQYNSIHVHYSF